MDGIRKAFGTVVALDGVDLEVDAREVHGLLGGNGAGKTTLMNVLYGLYAADSGKIYLNGREVSISSPRDAIAAGIGMVHQTFLQVDTFTVTENVALGTSVGRRKMDLAPARDRVIELSERFGLAVDPDAVVEDLPVGIRQRVEILKALYRGARVLVLDEPTTNLTPQEVDALFLSMRAIVDEGMSVILITHKIRETMAVCDRMTVMREGRKVAVRRREETSADDLAATMVGEMSGSLSAAVGQSDLRTVVGAASVAEVSAGGGPSSEHDVRVDVRDLTVVNDLGVPAVHGVSMQIPGGQVLGIAGVAGNGQGELAEALAGVRPPLSGAVIVDGRDLSGLPTAEWLRHGVSYVPEDRQRDGILPTATITENLLLGTHRSRSRGNGLIDWAVARRDAERAIAEYSIQASGPDVSAGQLSGGNVQRVILARAFAHRPRLLVLHNPTRGLDIRSTQFVYNRVREATDQNCAVVVISEDLDELVALADRVLVIYAGRIVGEHVRGQLNPYELGRQMAGVGAQESA